jgi:2-polyprenyl-3-methyl-5-hydroxy-6-metoxy-1,4-benzoquinol methylase
MRFANPVERSLADGRFYEQRAHAYYLSSDKLAGDYAPVRFDRELRLFERYCPRGDVLDVGCSTGGFLYQLTTRNPGRYQVVGTDVAGPALDYAVTHGVPVKRGVFAEVDFGPQRFDAITFWAVLEHLADPAAFLAKAESMLTPGGHLFALVPNMKSLAVRWLGARYRYLRPEHLNYFTADTLKRIATAGGGFEIAALRTTHFNPIVLWQDFRTGSSEVSDADRASLLRRTTRWKQLRLLWPVQKLYSGVEWLLGRAQLADNLIIVLRKRAT